MKAMCKVLRQMTLLVGLLIFAMPNAARAADVTFLCAGALESWVKEVIPEFQKASEHNVKVTFAAINIITDRVRKGEVADLAIVSPQQWEELQKEGKLDPAVRVVIAKVGHGVFVRKGAAKPDIGSVEAFKRAFLNARSIALFDPAGGGPTAVYGARLFDQLGISAALKPKIKHPTGGAAPLKPISSPLFELVANGTAEIGLAQISGTLAAPGVDLVGPVPAEIQNFTIFTTVIPENAREPAAAKALIEFLTSPKATSVQKSKGLEQR